MIVIAGPCVIDEQTEAIAERLDQIFLKYGDDCQFYFKASYDKANRSRGISYRGPGFQKGIERLAKLKDRFGFSITTDVHTEWQAEQAAQVVDVIQIPALLCRQTDLLVAAGYTAKAVNIKKGQFMAPWDMQWAVEKVRVAGCQNVAIIERGTCFGYNRLVVDMLSIRQMRELTACPVIIDCTHSLQLPGAGSGCSASLARAYAATLANAATAAGSDGIFLECYPIPDQAKCDGPNSVTIEQLDEIIGTTLKINRLLNYH